MPARLLVQGKETANIALVHIKANKSYSLKYICIRDKNKSVYKILLFVFGFYYSRKGDYFPLLAPIIYISKLPLALKDIGLTQISFQIHHKEGFFFKKKIILNVKKFNSCLLEMGAVLLFLLGFLMPASTLHDIAIHIHRRTFQGKYISATKKKGNIIIRTNLSFHRRQPTHLLSHCSRVTQPHYT